MKKLILITAVMLAFVPKVWAGATCYTVVPYTFSVAMWGSQGPAAPALPRNLIPQAPIFGWGANGELTTAASLAACIAERQKIKAALGTLRLVTECLPTTPVVLDGPIQ